MRQVYNTVPTDSRGYLTLQGYLSQWTLWTLLGAGRTLEYLGHLGYSYVMEEQQSAAIHGELQNVVTAGSIPAEEICLVLLLLSELNRFLHLRVLRCGYDFPRKKRVSFSPFIYSRIAGCQL